MNGQPTNNEARSSYHAVNAGIPLNRSQALKLTWVIAETHVRIGANSEGLHTAWTVVF